MIKIVATDLDGTLLRSTPPASPRSIAAIERVQERGAWVVPVTARAPWSTGPIAEEFGIRGYAVCNSGGTLFDLDRRVILEEQLIEPDVAMAAVRALREHLPGAAFAAVRGDEYARESAYAPAVRPPEGHFVGDALEFFDRPVQKLNLQLAGRAPEHLVPIVLEAAGDALSVRTSGGSFVELLPRGVHKAHGLELLCARLGVRAAEVIAFGDHANDVEMLRWAGRGVAMANAEIEATEAADEQCPTNDEDGVAQVLERLLNEGAFG